MSSRPIGVTKVELSRRMMSWVIRSPSCSALRISRPRPLSSGQLPIIWSSSRAVRSVFCPASMKSSKKTLSRGRSERRAIAESYGSAGRRELLGGAGAVTPAELLLDAATLPSGWAVPRPDSVGAELPGVGVLGEAALQHVEQLCFQTLVFDRRH